MQLNRYMSLGWTGAVLWGVERSCNDVLAGWSDGDLPSPLLTLQSLTAWSACSRTSSTLRGDCVVNLKDHELCQGRPVFAFSVLGGLSCDGWNISFSSLQYYWCVLVWSIFYRLIINRGIKKDFVFCVGPILDFLFYRVISALLLLFRSPFFLEVLLPQ